MLFVILFVASFLLVPTIIYWQAYLLGIKNYVLSIAGAAGLAKAAEKLHIIELPFFRTLLSSVITVALLGGVCWGALYFLRFEPSFWHHLIQLPEKS